MEEGVLDTSAASAVDDNGIEFTSEAACTGVIGIGIGALNGGGKKTGMGLTAATACPGAIGIEIGTSAGGGIKIGAGIAANSRFTIGEHRLL